MSDALLALLFEARRLNNQTVRKADEVDDWHRTVDIVLRTSPNGGHHDPEAEWGAPKRVAHRKFIRDMLNPGKSYD